MYNNSYMRRGGCPTCGINNNNNLRDSYSPQYNYNRNNNNPITNSSYDFYQNSYNNSYNDRLQRIMTPPRNYSYYNINNDYSSSMNRNNYPRYESPTRNSGCLNCSMSPSKDYNDNNYLRPPTSNIMKRNNSFYTFNNNNNNNNTNLYNTGYNFRKRYKSNNNNNNEDMFDNTYKQNRSNNQLRKNPQRSLVNSFSNPNLLRNNNNNNNSQYRNYLNNVSNNNTENRNNYDNNSYYSNVRTSLDNAYRNFLNDNINKYNYNSDSKNNYNYNRGERKNYYSPSFRYSNTSINNNRSNDNYSINNRYSYSPNEIYDDKFIKLNLYNYQRTIRELIQNRKTFFIVIYGSHDYTGQSWCSDCNTAMPNIEQAKNTIKNNNDREIYFIDIPIDKINMRDLANDGIIQLERVPTLIYFDDGIERGRLVENELFSYSDVNNFVLQAYDSYNPRGNQSFYRYRNYY